MVLIREAGSSRKMAVDTCPSARYARRLRPGSGGTRQLDVRAALTALLAIQAVLVCARDGSAESPPFGAEFVVNTYTTGDQTSPDVAVQSTGEFVVVYQRATEVGAQASAIRARRYDALGNPIGGGFQVDTHTSGTTFGARVAVLSDDGFVVVWQHRLTTEPPHDNDVFGRRFDASGTPSGTQFLVNTYTTGAQDPPAVAAGPGGTFTVTWFEPEIHMRRYDGAGAALGPPVQVNTEIVGACRNTTNTCYTDVSTNDSGTTMIAWPSLAPTGYPSDLAIRLFDAGGSPLGTEFAANTYTTGPQEFPSVETAEDGGFLVTWHSDRPPPSQLFRLMARRFDDAGNPLGPGVGIADDYTSFQCCTDLTRASDGSFLVAWASQKTPGYRARRLDDMGVPMGTDFRLNTTPAATSPFAAIAGGVNDEVFALWHARVLGDGSDLAVVGRFACVGGPDDVDLDGISDDCDACTNTGGQLMSDKTRLKMQRIHTDPVVDNDRLVFKGDLTLPPDSDFSSIAPETTPVRFVVGTADGTGRIDVELAATAFAGAGTAGWTQTGSGRKWKYRDKRPLRANGIKTASLVDKSAKEPRQVRVKLRGQDGVYSVDDDDLPLDVAVILGDAAAEMCGEIAYAPGECDLRQTRLRCRR